MPAQAIRRQRNLRTDAAFALSLAPAKDDAFRWMLGRTERPPYPGLRRPDQGVASPADLEELWSAARRCRDCRTPASWIMIVDAEAVGLVTYKDPPRKSRRVEIGYGVAASRRDRGYATRAVFHLIGIARSDPRLLSLEARTVFGNVASERVLSTNGFVHLETRVEPELGAVRLWRLALV